MNLHKTTLDRTSDTEILIVRTFRAPPQLLYRAWTQPEHVRRWWAPQSRGASVVECSADLRPGGGYRYVLQHGDQQFAFAGEYRELNGPNSLVYTQRFEPVLGEPMPGEALITITFEAQGELTRLVARERYPSKEVLDGVLASGMEEGMRETYEQLDALVQTLSA